MSKSLRTASLTKELREIRGIFYFVLLNDQGQVIRQKQLA